MLKLEAVVTHMEKILEDVSFLVGEKSINIEEILKLHSFEVFSNETVEFLSELSNRLLKHPQSRKFPDVATFAFYCRKANLSFLKKNHLSDQALRLGRGIVFHITPGNVPVNFAYSLMAGLLTGNINIVKVPSKQYEQVNLVINSIREILQEKKYNDIFSKRLYIVRYDRESMATALFSSISDVRIIWGGDQTINDIRRYSISPKSTEVTFSDRYSISVINASEYLKSVNKDKVVQGFYNDTYLFDQNACTSPQTIYWLGSKIEIENAKKTFWELMQNVLDDKKFDLQPILSIDKLTTFYTQAILYGDIKKEPQNTNEIWRVNNTTMHIDIDLHKCSSGYFNEISISSLDELEAMINRRYQTIGYFGINEDEFKRWIIRSKPLAIAKIVPIGRTMDFSLFWDGYDLVSSLSRLVQIV